MKQLIRFIIIVFTGIVIFNACDTQELKDLNVNPAAANDMDPGYLFSYAILTTEGQEHVNSRALLSETCCFNQHWASLYNWVGDKYLHFEPHNSALYDFAWRYMKELVWLTDVMLLDNPDHVNNLSMTRIWKVLAFHKLTDIYGDISYSEAGKAYIDGNYTPRYDTQEYIYDHMLTELEQATAAFNPSVDTWSGQDFVYQGDITKWEKFGYSLMLRLGMRLSKVDPAAAQSWVQKAIAGGVIDNFDDAALIYYDATGSGIFNWNGFSYAYSKDGTGRLSNTLIDMLINTNDPRLDVIAVKIPGYDTVGHKGMPNGYNVQTIKDYEGTGGAEVDINIYDEINPLLVQLGSPKVFMTLAETEFLLAEAAERSWGSLTPADAQQHYENGVRAAMHQYSFFDASLDISDTDIDTYLAANPYANGLEQIGEQMWINLFLDELECFAHIRRTGYPALTPVDYPGNNARSQLPRRLKYSSMAYSSNNASVTEAVARQGEDEMWTRIWWDVAK